MNAFYAATFKINKTSLYTLAEDCTNCPKIYHTLIFLTKCSLKINSSVYSIQHVSRFKIFVNIQLTERLKNIYLFLIYCHFTLKNVSRLCHKISELNQCSSFALLDHWSKLSEEWHFAFWRHRTYFMWRFV